MRTVKEASAIGYTGNTKKGRVDDRLFKFWCSSVDEVWEWWNISRFFDYMVTREKKGDLRFSEGGGLDDFNGRLIWVRDIESPC